MFTHAIVRIPCDNFASGLTTSGYLGAPDLRTMLIQHDIYVESLRNAGLTIITMAPEEAFPDAHFVEDAAVVMPEMAVITNPGAPERNGEQHTVARVLGRYKRLARIEAPGTMDGGDVLLVDRHFFVGVSERTNAEGARQFEEIVRAHGYTVTTVPVGKGLHFKSGVNHVGGRTLLVTPDFAELDVLSGYDLLVTPEDDEYAANTLLVNDTLLTPAGYPGVRELLDGLGKKVVELDMSETRRMDGGLTCLSLRFAV